MSEHLSSKHYPSEADWRKYAPVMRFLYFDEGRPLAQVIKIMESKYGFWASEKMYKSRFKTMGILKNLRPAEALAMARVKTWRDEHGIASEFWRSGRLVDQQKLERYLRLNHAVRKRLEEFSVQDRKRLGPIEALLPPHIVVLSPSAPIRLSEDLELTEKIFSTFWTYMSRRGSPDHRWVGNDSMPVPASKKINVLYWKLEQNMHAGIENLRSHPDQGGQQLREAFSLIEPILSMSKDWTLVPLLWRFSRLHRLSWANRAPEVVRLLVDHMGQTSAAMLGKDHPFTIIFQGFARYMFDVDKRSSLLALASMWRLVRDSLERLGMFGLEYSIAYHSLAQADAMLADTDPEERSRLIEASYRGQVDRLAEIPGDHTAFQRNVYRIELAQLLETLGRNEEAIEVFSEALSAPEEHMLPAARWLGYQRLAHLHKEAGRLEESQAILEKSSSLATETHKDITHDPDTFLSSVLCSLSGEYSDMAGHSVKVISEMDALIGPTE